LKFTALLVLLLLFNFAAFVELDAVVVFLVEDAVALASELFTVLLLGFVEVAEAGTVEALVSELFTVLLLGFVEVAEVGAVEALASELFTVLLLGFVEVAEAGAVEASTSEFFLILRRIVIYG